MAVRGQKGPRTVTTGLRQRAWWVLRARGTVTIPGVLSAIADGTEKAAASNIRRYFKALEYAGILTILPDRDRGKVATGQGFVRYRLVRNNGRMAPVVRQSMGEVFDPNTDEVFKLLTANREGA